MESYGTALTCDKISHLRLQRQPGRFIREVPDELVPVNVSYEIYGEPLSTTLLSRWDAFSPDSIFYTPPAYVLSFGQLSFFWLALMFFLV